MCVICILSMSAGYHYGSRITLPRSLYDRMTRCIVPRCRPTAGDVYRGRGDVQGDYVLLSENRGKWRNIRWVRKKNGL